MATTPRMRATYAYYTSLVVATALMGRPHPAAPLIEQALNTAALLLVALAVIGRIWCSAFIAGHKEQRLIVDGPYSLCRHPLYALSFIGGLGLGIATHSLVFTLLTAGVLAALFTRGAYAEEALLARTHGAAFALYAQRTPRWWPRWSAYRLPPRLDPIPQVFWKAFRDAAAFILLYLLIDTARTLRETGVLPTLLQLP